jgi:uncharacterized protein (UPF0333 family)
MKHAVTVVLLAAISLAAPLAASAEESSKSKSADQTIAKIKQYREAAEEKLRDNKFTRKEIR